MNTTEESIEQVKQPKCNYYQECLQAALKYLSSEFRSDKFTTELIKSAYSWDMLIYGKEFEPAEPRVWGAVMRELVRRGLIEKVGFGTYQNPAGHGRPVNVWRVKQITGKVYAFGCD